MAYARAKRLVAKDSIVILDGMNYIKGWRYQLWCESKAAGTSCCVVRFSSVYPDRECAMANQAIPRCTSVPPWINVSRTTKSVWIGMQPSKPIALRQSKQTPQPKRPLQRSHQTPSRPTPPNSLTTSSSATKNPAHTAAGTNHSSQYHGKTPNPQ